MPKHILHFSGGIKLKENQSPVLDLSRTLKGVAVQRNEITELHKNL